MLSYWILRDRNDAPIGLVKTDGDRVLLTINDADGLDFTLFSAVAETPVKPYRETTFPGAVALLGMQNGVLYAFAASPDAQARQTYLDRLSRIRTIETEPTPPQKPPEIPQEPPSEEPQKSEGFPDVSDTARATGALFEQLRRADAFYERFAQFTPPVADAMVQKEDTPSEEPHGIDLLPQLFPSARWRYVDGADVLGHYEGEYRYPNGARVRILAGRGKSAPRPPRTLVGFTRFVRAPDGTGYWLRFMQ